jgi:predicted phosphodiesterase
MAATYDIIILVTDVHGLILEFKEFLNEMIKRYGDKISYCVQLGDFFKGRNVIRGEKTFSLWKDPSIFSDLPFPIYSIKGNEDINIPESWFTGMISVLPNMKEFILDDLKIIPVHFFEESEEFYHSHGIKKLIPIRDDKKNPQNKPLVNQTLSISPYFEIEPTNDRPISPILTENNKIDIIMSHVPPFGYLDRTRDYTTHQEIHGTGNKFLRFLIDKRKPKMVIFGHNHYCNFQQFGNLMVLSIDKFCRKMAEGIEEEVDLDREDDNNPHHNKLKFGLKEKSKSTEVKDRNFFSYCLIIRKGDSYILEVYRRDQLIIQYDISTSKILLNKL